MSISKLQRDINRWAYESMKVSDHIPIRRPELTVNHIKNVVEALERSHSLVPRKNLIENDYFTFDAIYKPFKFVNTENSKEETMQYTGIKTCENGYVITQIPGSCNEKVYVASDEKELARLIEKLAKEAKDPVKK